MVPVFRKDVELERTERDEMKGNVQSHTLLRFGTAERLSADSHDRGDAVLFGQVRRIVLLTACKANRDHLPRGREESVWCRFWVLITPMCVLQAGSGSPALVMSSCGTKF